MMVAFKKSAAETIDTLERAAALAEGYTAMMHTSWSHTPEHPKARLVFPFAEPAPVARWEQVWDAAARWAKLGGLTLDPATKDASRLYFLPAYPVGDEARRRAFRSWVRYDDADQLLSWRRLLLDHPHERAERGQRDAAVRLRHLVHERRGPLHEERARRHDAHGR